MWRLARQRCVPRTAPGVTVEAGPAPQPDGTSLPCDKDRKRHGSSATIDARLLIVNTTVTHRLKCSARELGLQRASRLLSFRQWSELLTLATVNNDRHSGRYIIIAFIEDRIRAPL